MAKIIISTDDGTAIETIIDGDEEDSGWIGDLVHPVAQKALVNVIKRALHKAREADGRDVHGHPKVRV